MMRIPKKICIIGYRCTGKTTIGKRLADSYQVPFVDTDAVFQEQTGMTITEFVQKNGWNLFRETEKKILKKCISMDDNVISTGGGIVLDKANRDLMKNNSFCIWLNADVKIILDRLKKDEKTIDLRPALSDMDLENETIQMMQTREPLYRQMQQLTVDTGQFTPDECVKIIMRSLEDVRIQLWKSVSD